MFKRITTIVGAGAVLDFDYSYPNAIYPSTRNITNTIKNLSVRGLEIECSDVIAKVYELATNALNGIYRERNIRSISYELNFEEFYFLLESMLSFNSNSITYLDPNSCPPLSILLREVDELNNYPHIEYVRALYVIVKKIIEIIDKYDSHFRENENFELWYREFWIGRNNINYDVFTFNYDCTIEESMQEYEDGFSPINNHDLGVSYFDPKRLLTNSMKLSTIQHLHGCIKYSEYAPIECEKTHSNRDMFKMRTVSDALHQIGGQCEEQYQDRELFLNSPILVGLRKLDKMAYMPSSIYHADLVNKLRKNKGVLIVGYSFGDLYVNQLLQRRQLMKGDKHRMVIIEKFPSYVNSAVGVYQHLKDNCPKLMTFLKPFVEFRFDDHFQLHGIEFTSYNEPIYSEDYKCILFICGFREAVERHQDLIWRFL